MDHHRQSSTKEGSAGAGRQLVGPFIDAFSRWHDLLVSLQSEIERARHERLPLATDFSARVRALLLEIGTEQKRYTEIRPRDKALRANDLHRGYDTLTANLKRLILRSTPLTMRQFDLETAILTTRSAEGYTDSQQDDAGSAS